MGRGAWWVQSRRVSRVELRWHTHSSKQWVWPAIKLSAATPGQCNWVQDGKQDLALERAISKVLNTYLRNNFQVNWFISLKSTKTFSFQINGLWLAVIFDILLIPILFSSKTHIYSNLSLTYSRLFLRAIWKAVSPVIVYRKSPQIKKHFFTTHFMFSFSWQEIVWIIILGWAQLLNKLRRESRRAGNRGEGMTREKQEGERFENVSTAVFDHSKSGIPVASKSWKGGNGLSSQQLPRVLSPTNLP